MAHFDLVADRVLLDTHRRLRAGNYRPAAYHLKIVKDPKTRLIAAPAIIDRVVQTALVNEIGPTYEQSFIDQSYACRIGRGPQRALLAYLAATRRFAYRLSLDIRRYFASVRHDILLALFEHRLRDAQTRKLLRLLIENGGRVYQSPLARTALQLDAFPLAPGCGMPLGSYLSHWSGALYLDGLDHFVKRTLKIHGYQRYMDDFILFSDSRVELDSAREAIGQWLREKRALDLKDAAAPVRPTAEASTYLGMRVSRAGIAPGPKAKRRLRMHLRTAHTMDATSIARGLQSYRGMMLSIG